MFTFMHNLWMTLQCPPPLTSHMWNSYEEPTATKAIAYLDKWLPYLCDYDKGELFSQMSYDLAFEMELGDYNDQLFEWFMATDQQPIIDQGRKS